LTVAASPCRPPRWHVGCRRHGESCIDHRHQRTGRRVSRRAAAQERLRRPRHQAADVAVQYRPGRSSLPGGGARRDSVHAPPRRHDGFEEPEYTADADALGTLRLLEAIRILKLEGTTRFYQASTSELYGGIGASPQNEQTPFHPRSPYGVAKLYAYWITVNYREAYGLYACNGVLFNHESPIRGETFVTRKVTRALSRISLGMFDCLYLGNLNARRDWGHARDYAEAMWLMLQQPKPEDFVVATGEQRSVRDFVTEAAAALGITLAWSGAGKDEVGTVTAATGDSEVKVGQVIVRVDPSYLRPAEVESLVGDAAKARRQLGWRPRTSFSELVTEMATADLALARREKATSGHGLKVYRPDLEDGHKW
jgi:GDPmannose 4,6-dehydratase